MALDWSLFLCGFATRDPRALYVLQARWSYTIRSLGSFPRQSVNLLLALVAALVVWNAACVLTGSGEPYVLRQWSLRWAVWGWGLGAFARAVFAFATVRWTRQGRLARRTVIVGGGAQALETVRRLEKSGKGALGSWACSMTATVRACRRNWANTGCWAPSMISRRSAATTRSIC